MSSVAHRRAVTSGTAASRMVASVIALAALSALGCAGARCPAPTLRFTDAAAVVEHHGRLLAWAGNLRAEARVDRRDGDARVRGTVLMMVERPDRVRFDAMTQFGPAAVLTSDGHAFALTDLRENRFFAGPTCAENIALLLGIPMEGEEIGRVLFGESPTIVASERSVECDGGSYRVHLRAADGARQELVYEVRQDDVEGPPEAQRLRMRASELYGADGAMIWRIRWDDHRFVEDPRDTETPRRGVALPYRVQVELPAQGIDTLVRFERIEINVELPVDAFSQDVRPGLSVEPVECGE